MGRETRQGLERGGRGMVSPWACLLQGGDLIIGPFPREQVHELTLRSSGVEKQARPALGGRQCQSSWFLRVSCCLLLTF